MVSFWPFKGDDTSAASFEKSLSQLAVKINKASASNDNLRQHQRRFKVLWTLYSSFAYILVALILTLVTGWERWSAVEYSAVAGGPVIIYGVRTALDAYYNYRLSNSQSHLNELYKQREATIEKLKTATKYNSTQQLLDKYGGQPQQQKRQPSPGASKKRKSEGGQLSNQSTPQGGRTGFMPPPTANIPARQPPKMQMMAESSPGSGPPQAGLSPPGSSSLMQNIEPGEEFAPNAFSAPTRPAPMRQPSSSSQQFAAEGPKWYDRILDVVLGEDEAQARNRIALICSNCRLVNGQAPPGVRTLEEIGKWRCSACHITNGVESEEKRMLKQIAGEPVSPSTPTTAVDDAADKEGASDMDEDEAPQVEEDIADITGTPAGSTRSKARQRKKP